MDTVNMQETFLSITPLAEKIVSSHKVVRPVRACFENLQSLNLRSDRIRICWIFTYSWQFNMADLTYYLMVPTQPTAVPSWKPGTAEVVRPPWRMPAPIALFLPRQYCGA